MPGGVPPKPAELRQRRNKKSTAAKLPAVNPDAIIPPLPMDRVWTEQTIQEWTDIWQSGMATQYMDSDFHGLLKLAVLVDDFWKAESPTQRRDTLIEIRMQRVDFGLAPTSRARLHWEIDRAEQAKERTDKRKQRHTTPATPADDPRAVLGRQQLTLVAGGKKEAS